MTVYDYARVSSEGQSLTARVAELKADGCQRVFQEKVSSARRTASNWRGFWSNWTTAYGGRYPSGVLNPRSAEHAGCHRCGQCTFRSLHDTWADTTTPHGRLILTVLGGLAEFERHLIVAHH